MLINLMIINILTVFPLPFFVPLGGQEIVL